MEAIYGHLPIALQDAVVSRYGREILKERFGPECDRLTALLERSQWFSRDELRALQDERLAPLIEHAYENVPFYRGLMDSLHLKPGDITTASDLSKLPILERQDVIGNREDLVSKTVNTRRLRKATTSGTTGSPLSVYWDRNVSVMNNACNHRTKRWAGFEFGSPYATMMGRVVVPLRQRHPPFWRFNRSWNQLLLSPIHLGPDNLPHYVRKLREAGIEALEAYPSSSYVLAKYLESVDDYLKLRVVFSSSEPLLPTQREVIEERFQCRVFDAYSQTERVMYSSECERHAGHHVFDEYGILELVDRDGRPVEPGTMGQVVATGLHNYAMPLIRYAVGDTATLNPASCPCGRSLQLLDGVTTKAEDIVVTPDGRMLPPYLLTYPFKSVHAVAKSQILQHRPDEITVKLVKRNGYRDEHEGVLRRGLAERLGPDVTIAFEYVDDIPLSGRGKYRRVVSTVPLAWGTDRVPNLYDDGTKEEPAAGGGPSVRETVNGGEPADRTDTGGS